MKDVPVSNTIQQANHRPDAAAGRPGNSPQDRIGSEKPALKLVIKLCQALEEEGIAYCHWKSNNALDRSASGENDLDLLVSRADVARFTEILYRFGFKQAEAPDDKQMPGVLNYFGYDEEAGERLIHVHAHYQLILGHDRTKNYRLPIEKPYIESAVYDELFKVPAPEFEYLLLIIRLALKHLAWDLILVGDGKLKASERKELTYLQARIKRERVDEILREHLPYISVELFNKCARALQAGSSARMRAKTGKQLQAALESNTRHSLSADTRLKLWRRLTLAIYQRLHKTKPKHLLKSGGAMIAIVGGDGAGKTTVVDSLYAWLSKDFEVMKVHMGKPAWSWQTKVARAITSVGRMLGLYPHFNSSILYTQDSRARVLRGRYPWMLREVCKARDRYLTYLKAKRFANNGGLVICDRFPLPQIKLMDGPVIEQMSHRDNLSRFNKFLIALEQKYYRALILPELVVVLRLNPDIAVQRKTDENAADVRVRSTEIWEIDWSQTPINVIDTSRTRAEILSELKSLVWAEL